MDGLQLGRIVHYVLTEEDAVKINRRRTDGSAIAARIELGEWPSGAQAHVGYSTGIGQHVPAMIVHIVDKNGTVNLKCLLDGSDDYWVTSVPPDSYNEIQKRVDETPGTWHWLEKA